MVIQLSEIEGVENIHEFIDKSIPSAGITEWCWLFNNDWGVVYKFVSGWESGLVNVIEHTNGELSNAVGDVGNFFAFGTFEQQEVFTSGHLLEYLNQVSRW